jgi:hypothetical protein
MAIRLAKTYETQSDVGRERVPVSSQRRNVSS